MPRDLPQANGSLLINVDQTGQIRDIYRSHVGQQNHTRINVCRPGIGAFGMTCSDDPRMAEQVHPHSNEPLSVKPLAWSYTTYLPTLLAYTKKYREPAEG